MDRMSEPGLDSASSPDARGSAKALTKGLSIVDVVAEHGRPMRLTDLVDASDVPRPTALRLLDVLCRSEVLRVDERGRYALGPRLAVWGHAYLDRLDLRAQAADLMRDVVAATRETCFLGTLDAGRVLYIAVADSPQAVRPAARVGFRNPMHCTGIGKAMLAHLPSDATEAILALPLERRTPRTITDPERLRAELASTRARGYAVDDIENEDGVRCIAAPVRDHTGAVVAGLSVSAPAYRFSLDHLANLVPLVLSVTAELSGRLGYQRSEAEPGTLDACSIENRTPEEVPG
jgi:IclR family acetate operon transcriptional repressor